MKTFFCNRTVDKNEMKRLIKWVLLTYGTTKTTHLVDQLKTMGFHYATAAGISLGIDDLRVPPVKAAFMENAENEIYENILPPLRLLNANEQKDLIDNLNNLDFKLNSKMAA